MARILGRAATASLAISALALTSACTTRDPAPVRVAVAPPVALPPPPAITGKLLVFDGRSGFFLCARTGDDLEATCTNVPVPGAQSHMDIAWRDAAGLYFVPLGDDPKTAGLGLWEPLTGALRRLEGVKYDRYEVPVQVLADGSLVRFEHLPNFSRVLRAKAGGRFVAVAALDALRGYGFELSPRGQVLFLRTPGMGGPESPYFIDVVKGSTTALYYADSLDVAPKRLATREQFMEADFIDDGRTIAYYRPGTADESKNERTFTLETVDTATAAEHAWGTVTLPLRGYTTNNPVYSRKAPRTRFFTHAPWVLLGLAETDHFVPRVLRLVNVTTGESSDIALEENEVLMESIPKGGMVTFGYEPGRSDAPVMVTCSGQIGTPRDCRVRALPSLEVVMTVTIPDVARAADWIAL